jgi:MerR family transcriptional regulator, light-induced transcriptional regulator
MPDVQCSIKLAAKKSGLTPHVIRIWEKRYDAVSPHRSGTNRRLYSEEDISRLRMLGAAVHSGHRIGNIARLSDEQLRCLVPEVLPAGTRAGGSGRPAGDVVAAGLAAVRALDEAALEAVLDQSLLAFGGHGLLANLVAPLAQEVGTLWRDGVMTAAHEHFATAVVRTFLLKNFRPFGSKGDSPRLIAVTPAGQLHELGAVIVAVAANDVGWNAVYLGASLPAAEIAGAAIQHNARAVALSIVYPPDDPQLPVELAALRRHLPASTGIIAGGRAADSYAAALDAIGALRVSDLRQLYDLLETTRTPARKAAESGRS